MFTLTGVPSTTPTLGILHVLFIIWEVFFGIYYIARVILTL